MALINILVNRDKLANKGRRLVDMYTEKNDSFSLQLTPFLYALWSMDDTLIEQALTLINKALDVYWERGEATYGYETMYSKVVSFALISHVFGTDRSEFIEKLKSVKIKGKKNELIQESLGPIEETEKPMTGHVNSAGKLYSKLKKWNLEYDFDLLSCHDHPLWVQELSNFLIPIAYRLHQKKDDKSKESFLNVLNRNQTKDEELLIVLQDENGKEEIADVVLADAKSLTFVKWLGFDTQSTIDLSFIENHDKAMDLLKEKITSKEWDIVTDKIENNQWKYLILYDSALMKFSNENIVQLNEQLGLNIEFSDFTEF